MSFKGLACATTTIGLLAAGMLATSGPAQASSGDVMYCGVGYQSTPVVGVYAICDLVTTDGLETNQVWSMNGYTFATNTSHVTPGCGGYNTYYSVTVSYIDQGAADSQEFSGICGGGSGD